MTLYKYRILSISSVLKKQRIKSIIDFGCGDGKLLYYLSEDNSFESIAGVDISQKRIDKILKKFACSDRNRIFIQSFFDYNVSFKQYEAIVLSEVIEHYRIDEVRVLLNLILNEYKPKTLIITTPNRSYNTNFDVLFEGLRHKSHLFEFSDEEVMAFCHELQKTYSDYKICNAYCDPNKASHLIIIEKRNNENE